MRVGIPFISFQPGLLVTPSVSVSAEFWQLVEDATRYLDPARPTALLRTPADKSLTSPFLPSNWGFYLGVRSKLFIVLCSYCILVYSLQIPFLCHFLTQKTSIV